MPIWVRSLAAACAGQPGQPEVGHLHLAAGGEHDVFRLDVAMDHPLLGRLGQRRGHLPHDRQGVGQIGRAVPADVIAEVLPLHVLLGDVVQVVDAAHLVNLHDVGVDQRGGRLGLQLEPLQIDPIAGQFRLEDFDGHPPLQPFLLGQIDFGHRPAAQPPQQTEIAQLPAGKVGIGGGSRRLGEHRRTWRFVNPRAAL